MHRSHDDRANDSSVETIGVLITTLARHPPLDAQLKQELRYSLQVLSLPLALAVGKANCEEP